MVRNIIKFFGEELKGVHQAAFLLAFAGILSDVIALFRDRLLASEFGASRALDIYYVSFRVPDFIYTLSLFFAASTALIPILLEKFNEDEKRAQEFLGNIFSLFGIVVIFLVVVSYLLMPILVPLVSPGFDFQEQADVILLSRILLLSPLFLGLSNLVSSVIQSFRRFYIYALSPLLYNVGIIFGIVFLRPHYGLSGIVWGVVLGALLHFAIQIPSVWSLGFSLRLRFPKISPDVVRSLKLSAPRTLGLSLNQLLLTFLTAMGSTLGSGAVAVFNFASNLQSIPLSIIGLSYSVAAFPTLASSYVKNNQEEFRRHFSLSFRHIVFWSLPATVLFMVLRAHIVRVVLGAGAFSWLDTRLTAATLLLFSLSILAQGLILLLVRAFYATGRTILPVLVNLASSAVAVSGAFWFLNLLRSSVFFRNWFLSVLKVSDIPGGEVLVLPLALSLGSLVNVLLLLFCFNKIFGLREASHQKTFSRSFADAALTSVVVGFVAYYSLRVLAPFLNQDTFVGIFAQGFLAGLLGLLAGALALYFLKNREFMEIADAFKRKLWGSVPVLSSEPEKLP